MVNSDPIFENLRFSNIIDFFVNNQHYKINISVKYLFHLSKSQSSGKFEERNSLIDWLIFTNLKIGWPHPHYIIFPNWNTKLTDICIVLFTKNSITVNVICNMLNFMQVNNSKGPKNRRIFFFETCNCLNLLDLCPK